MLLQNLKTNYPKSWVEFLLVAKEVVKTSPTTANLIVEQLPFELAFGLLLKFFKENELEFDYNNLEPEQYETEIEGIFASFENTISHYS